LIKKRGIWPNGGLVAGVEQARTLTGSIPILDKESLNLSE